MLNGSSPPSAWFGRGFRRTLPGVSAPPFILGLAGAIGAGKSAAAAILAKLGAHAIDFDALARAALDRPEVARTLASWWGEEVRNPDGTTNRPAVARRVFNNPAERARLEALIHPLVWRTREQASAEALAAGASIAVMDAPLLYEAGLDRECDAVLFVDADRAIRLARVRESRGWDEAELDRREAAQIPADEKRRRAAWSVTNNSDLGQLELAIRRILDTIRSSSQHLSSPP